MDEVIKLISQTPLKQSDLDPMPTWLLKDTIDIFLRHMLRISLTPRYPLPVFLMRLKQLTYRR